MWWLEGRGAEPRNPDFEKKTVPKLVEAVARIIQDAGSSPAASIFTLSQVKMSSQQLYPPAYLLIDCPQRIPKSDIRSIISSNGGTSPANISRCISL
jgi:hypothetical protein